MIINAPVVLSIVAISFLATLLNYVTNGASTELLFSTYHSALLSPMTWLRAFTHIFWHVDWGHFIGNMSYLLLLGPMLEEKYGSQILVEIMAITAFVTSLVNYFLFPAQALFGGKRCRICFYPVVFLHQFPGRGNSPDLYPCGGFLHWSADI